MHDERAARVRLLILDVDGVLTDGRINIDDHGVETKRFHVRDGTGMRIWQRLGHEIAVITGRGGMALRHRLNELGVSHVIQHAEDKARSMIELCQRLEIDVEEAAVLADDLPDLPMLDACGYPMAVSDASREVREVAAFTTVRPGGTAAVREAIEHLINAQRRWDEAVALYRIQA